MSQFDFRRSIICSVSCRLQVAVGSRVRISGRSAFTGSEGVVVGVHAASSMPYLVDVGCGGPVPFSVVEVEAPQSILYFRSDRIHLIEVCRSYMHSICKCIAAITACE